MKKIFLLISGQNFIDITKICFCCIMELLNVRVVFVKKKLKEKVDGFNNNVERANSNAHSK